MDKMIFGFMSQIQNIILEVLLNLICHTTMDPLFNGYGFIIARILLNL
jgi:hypothetical protein